MQAAHHAARYNLDVVAHNRLQLPHIHLPVPVIVRVVQLLDASNGAEVHFDARALLRLRSKNLQNFKFPRFLLFFTHLQMRQLLASNNGAIATDLIV